MKFIKFLSLFLIFFSCAQVTSLNLKKHQFGKLPTKIIWLQVPGLDNEHLALLKYSYPSRDRKTAFEESLCVGKVWDYDLYKIRPNAANGTLSQLTGKKNIKNTCEDYNHKPIWKYVGSKNYKTGVFEGELKPKQSLLKSKSCEGAKDYLDEVRLWTMNKGKPGAKYFHIDDQKPFEAGKIYYDRSCSSGECYTNFARNVEAVFQSFQKNTKNYVFVVRNFKYLNLVKANKIKDAKLELEEINTALKYFQDIARKSSDVLVLLSSSEAQVINFPKSGNQWKYYEEKAKYIKRVNSKLLSPVYATGARAENFCGIFEQSDLLPRIFSGARQQGLEFSIINPFE